MPRKELRHHNIQHNDIQHTTSQHTDCQHYDTEHNRLKVTISIKDTKSLSISINHHDADGPNALFSILLQY